MKIRAKILISLIIVIVLVLGFWKGWEGKGGEAVIITDKKEYQSGGILRVKIKNDFRKNICFSSCYPYYLERLHSSPLPEDGSLTEKWESYQYGECLGFNSNGDCIEAKREKAFELVLPQISDNFHRLVIPVCIGCQKGEPFREDRRFYSNEFLIK